jgi:hypothetical protein
MGARLLTKRGKRRAGMRPVIVIVVVFDLTEQFDDAELITV